MPSLRGATRSIFRRHSSDLLLVAAITITALFIRRPSSLLLYLAFNLATYVLARRLFNPKVATLALLIASCSRFSRQSLSLPAFTLDFDPYYFFEVAFPILAGARWNYSQLDLLPILSPLLVFFYLFAITVFLVFRPSRVLAAILLAYPALYSFTHPVTLEQDAGFLALFFPFLAIIASWFLWHIFDRTRILGSALAALILTVTAYGTVTLDRFQRIKTEPDPALLKYLSDNHLHYFTATPGLVPKLATQPAAFIAYPDEATPFAQHLKEAGLTLQSKQIGNYTLFRQIHEDP